MSRHFLAFSKDTKVACHSPFKLGEEEKMKSVASVEQNKYLFACIQIWAEIRSDNIVDTK